MSNFTLALLANDPEALKVIIKEAVEEALSKYKPAIVPIQEKLLTQEEVIEKLDITQTTLIRWKKDGLIPYVKLGNRCYYEWAAIIAAGKAHEKYTRRR